MRARSSAPGSRINKHIEPYVGAMELNTQNSLDNALYVVAGSIKESNENIATTDVKILNGMMTPPPKQGPVGLVIASAESQGSRI